MGTRVSEELRRRGTGAAWMVALLMSLTLGVEASARVTPPGVPGCGCEARGELLAQRERLAGAVDAERARELALDDVRGARRALGIAGWLVPDSDELRAARARVDAYVRNVEQARSAEEVAERFAAFVQVADGSDIVGVDGRWDGGDGRCNFSDREIIAIVLGFILGIIPGLILIVLLC